MSDDFAAQVSPDLQHYLFNLTLHGIKLGLQNIEALLDAAGNPHRTYPTVHIGGTNGKGSVVALLNAMLLAAGYRTGRFTSPHLIDLSERFQIDSGPIPPEALDENIAYFREAAEQLEYPPTFFELNTAVAFRWFAQAGVDAALIEVGLGGRLDSTNVISPLVCAITNIDLEHTQYLGDTLEKIAFEKAGILKPGVPAVVGETRDGPRNVILARAEEVGSPVSLLGRDFQFSVSGPPWRQQFSFSSPKLTLDSVPLSLAGRYQGENAAVAVALASSLREHFPRLDNAAVCEGLAKARWPGRMERVLDYPPVIIDVAHNVAGARKLAETMGPYIIVLAVASDKDAAGMIELLEPVSSLLILTEFTGKRALPLSQLRAAAGTHGHQAVPTLEHAIAMGMKMASAESPLLITGSIYTAGEARRILMRKYDAPPLQF